MATKTINWNKGGGSFTVTYGGSGSGTIVVTSDANPLHEGRSQSLTVKTTKGGTVKKTITVAQAMKPYIDLTNAVVTAANQTYSGSALTPTPTVKMNGVTVPSTGYDVTYSNNTNVGTATIIITGKGDYTGTANGSFTINKANPTYTAPTAKSLTYNRGSQALLNAGSTSHGTIQYSSNGSSWSTTIPSQTNANTYTVYWRLVGDSNHADVSSTSINVTIAKATPVVATAPSARTGLTYTGSNQNLLSGGSMKHSSSDTTAVAGIFTYAQGKNAGTYSSLTWSFAPTDSTNYNSTSGTVSGSVSIAKANPTYTAPVARTNLIYNGGSKYLTTTGSTSHGTIYYSLDGTNWYTARRKSTNAGTYTSYWKLTGDANHNDVASTAITTTIAKASGSVTTAPTAKSVTYNGSSQTLINAGSGTGTMYYRYKLSTSSTWSSWSTSVPSRTNAGTYNIEYYAAASTNYEQSSTGSLNVTMAKATGKITFSTNSYTKEVGVDGDFTITPTKTGDGTVTYSSSNTSVATVNSSTGKVHIVGTGSVTITASMAQSTNYTSATGSYTVKCIAALFGCTFTYTSGGNSNRTPVTSYSWAVTSNMLSQTSGKTIVGIRLNARYSGKIDVTVFRNIGPQPITNAESLSVPFSNYENQTVQVSSTGVQTIMLSTPIVMGSNDVIGIGGMNGNGENYCSFYFTNASTSGTAYGFGEFGGINNPPNYALKFIANYDKYHIGFDLMYM